MILSVGNSKILILFLLNVPQKVTATKSAAKEYLNAKHSSITIQFPQLSAVSPGLHSIHPHYNAVVVWF